MAYFKIEGKNKEAKKLVSLSIRQDRLKIISEEAVQIFLCCFNLMKVRSKIDLDDGLRLRLTWKVEDKKRKETGRL